jgi:hypothetical protein
MRYTFAFALTALLTAAASPAMISQPPGAPASAPQAGNNPPIVQLGDPGVTPPDISPAAFPTMQLPHCRKWDGTVVLAAVIDSSGKARDVYFLAPTGDDLDKQSLEIVAEDRFKPGTLNGAPAATSVAIQVKMEFCIEPVTAGPNAGSFDSKLRSQPKQTIEPLSMASKLLVPVAAPKPYKGVVPPALLYDPVWPTHYGECAFKVLVDEHGLPQNSEVVRGGDSCRDFLKGVSRQRYRPAMKNGRPIAATIDVVESDTSTPPLFPIPAGP